MDQQQGTSLPPIEQYDESVNEDGRHRTIAMSLAVMALIIGLALGSMFESWSRDGRVWAGSSDVTLTATERRHAVEIEIHRQNIQFMRNNANSNHTAILNRLNEEDEGVQQDQVKFLFALKQAHELDPGKNYSLDAWRGKLVQQK